MTEEWRPILETAGRYSVSSWGRVRGENVLRARTGRTRKQGILKLRTDRYGYEVVVLSVEGRPLYRTVHRLVCEAFHGPAPEGKPFACHRDGDNRNNTPDNLYWGSPEDNMQDALRHGTNRNASKTHCPRGHEYNEANTFRGSRGERRCRECAKLYQRELRAKRALDTTPETA